MDLKWPRAGILKPLVWKKFYILRNNRQKKNVNNNKYDQKKFKNRQNI